MTKYLFIEYPKCKTCQKARKWLDDNRIDYIDRHIIEQTPTVAELKQWLDGSSFTPDKLFNTSGIKYRELNISAKRPTMSNDDILTLLSSDGMLIKRPLLINLATNRLIAKGFNKNTWSRAVNESTSGT